MSNMRKAYEGKDLLISRRNVSEQKLRERLSSLYKQEEIDQIIRALHIGEAWTDPIKKIGLAWNSYINKYTVFATGVNFDIIGD